MNTQRRGRCKWCKLLKTDLNKEHMCEECEEEAASLLDKLDIHGVIKHVCHKGEINDVPM